MTIILKSKTQEVYLVRKITPFDKNVEKSCLIQIHIKYANKAEFSYRYVRDVSIIMEKGCIGI